MKAFKYLVFFILLISSSSYALTEYRVVSSNVSFPWGNSREQACTNLIGLKTGSGAVIKTSNYNGSGSCSITYGTSSSSSAYGNIATRTISDPDPEPEPEPEKCEANTMPFSVKVPVDSGKMVCISGCQVSISNGTAAFIKSSKLAIGKG